jgi:excisionase family DNA binding protein
MLVRNKAPELVRTEQGVENLLGVSLQDVEKLLQAMLSEAPEDRPERRTKPMSLKEAAHLMGCSYRWLCRAIKSGAIKCTKLSRQQYIFDQDDVPPAEK